MPLALRAIGGAPLTATASQLSTARRTGASLPLAQGVANGLPILVESSGMVTIVAQTQATWVTNAQTQANIPETGLTVTPSGNLPINDPGPQPLPCVASLTAVCITHPTAFEWGTSSANGKPVGTQTITLSFADGTSGTTTDYVYDGWTLGCNAGWAYVNGVPVAQAAKATSDVYVDCVNSNVDFPKGAVVLSQPSPDQFGNLTTIMPTLTAQPIFAAANGVVSFSSIPPGIVFGIMTQDGGYAKVFFTSGAGVATLSAANGMALHSQSNGSFAF